MKLAPAYAFPPEHPSGVPGPVRYMGTFTFHTAAQLGREIAAKLKPGEVACAYPEGDSYEIRDDGTISQ